MYVQQVRLLDPSLLTGGGTGGGLELTHSYVDTMTPVGPRHASLQCHYGFACACSPPCEALARHGNVLGHAGRGRPSGRVEWALAQLEQGEEAHLRDVLDVLQAAAQQEEEGRTGLAEVGVGLYRARAMLMSSALEGGDDEEALSHALAMLPLLQRAYGAQPCHPILGLHYYTLADLWAAKGQHRQARQCYSQAATVLSATHGPKHDLVSALAEQLRQTHTAP